MDFPDLCVHHRNLKGLRREATRQIRARLLSLAIAREKIPKPAERAEAEEAATDAGSMLLRLMISLRRVGGMEASPPGPESGLVEIRRSVK